MIVTFKRVTLDFVFLVILRTYNTNLVGGRLSPRDHHFFFIEIKLVCRASFIFPEIIFLKIELIILGPWAVSKGDYWLMGTKKSKLNR